MRNINNSAGKTKAKRGVFEFSSASRQPPRDETLGADVESGLDSMFGRFFDNGLRCHRVKLRLAAAILWHRRAVQSLELLGNTWAALRQVLGSSCAAPGEVPGSSRAP